MMRFNQKFKYNQTYGDRGWNPNTYKKVKTFTNHIRQFKDKIRFKSVAFDPIALAMPFPIPTANEPVRGSSPAFPHQLVLDHNTLFTIC